jgi:hypothetical protein
MMKHRVNYRIFKLLQKLNTYFDAFVKGAYWLVWDYETIMWIVRYARIMKKRKCIYYLRVKPAKRRGVWQD